MPAYSPAYNTIADNALGGVNLGIQTTLEIVLVHENIAHNGTTNTGGSLTKANPGVLTIAGQTTQYVNGTAVVFAGSTLDAIVDGTTYFLKRSAGSSPNWTYTICATAALAANIDTSASGTANSGDLTSKKSGSTSPAASRRRAISSASLTGTTSTRASPGTSRRTPVRPMGRSASSIPVSTTTTPTRRSRGRMRQRVANYRAVGGVKQIRQYHATSSPARCKEVSNVHLAARRGRGGRRDFQSAAR